MEHTVAEKALVADLLTTAENVFGFTAIHAEPIQRGWLNLKWRLETDAGTFLLKQYNRERLKKYSIPDLEQVFTKQNHLHTLEFPCPGILSVGANQHFIQSQGGELFIVMDYCTGNNLPPGKLSREQCYALGHEAGKLHYQLRELPPKKRPVFTPPATSDRVRYWESVREEMRRESKAHLVPMIEKQVQLTKGLSLTDLDVAATGWSHRDLWVDNLLFTDNQLSAVLDFDRMNYDFPQLDVGRAIISSALADAELDMEKAKAFLEGYADYQVFGKGFLTKALKLLWYMESVWWLDLAMDERKGPPKRFVQEMLWLSEHLMELEELVDGN
ncbi:phosphotransferase [Ornithinibacillus contaminans]|uniref:phosphotransferase n=1 Tax=Ornithinibacillus contaminans TaxID=694055 RepID=UPI00064D8B7A|nr:phosphotransferase [Ornithinibacillus contaminans]